MTFAHLESIRQRFPKAYKKWSTEEDALLEQKHKDGATVKELALMFQRQPSAIKSRLGRLKPQAEQQRLYRGSVDISVVFEWEPVLRLENEEYAFPNQITSFMRLQYNKPAIYRWIIEHQGDDANAQVYIGEAVRLCPDRLSAYITPGRSQQTNLRLNRLFHESLSQGAIVQLEVLKLTGSFIADLTFSDKDLGRQDVRRLLERLLVVLYRNQGVELLNL